MAHIRISYNVILDRIDYYVNELQMTYGENRIYEIHEGLKALCDLIEAIDWVDVSTELKGVIQIRLDEDSKNLYERGYNGASARILKAITSINKGRN